MVANKGSAAVLAMRVKSAASPILEVEVGLVQRSATAGAGLVHANKCSRRGVTQGVTWSVTWGMKSVTRGTQSVIGTSQNRKTLGVSDRARTGDLQGHNLAL